MPEEQPRTTKKRGKQTITKPEVDREPLHIVISKEPLDDSRKSRKRAMTVDIEP
jgi:hypothetical protein